MDFLNLQILFPHFREKDCLARLGMTLFLLSLQLIQWGCFGFDSIRHWAVSTSGVGSLPVNLSFQTISWQQLLCTRCVVCKAHYLNPRGQGYLADEYPSALYAGYVQNLGYHSNWMLGVIPLSSAKT